MKDKEAIYQNRVRNLRQVMRALDGPNATAEKIGRHVSQLTDICGEKNQPCQKTDFFNPGYDCFPESNRLLCGNDAISIADETEIVTCCRA